MAVRYDAYCRADRVFYDSPTRLSDRSTRFAATDRNAPTGWDRSERGVWVTLRPTDEALPAQGWKIHVSSVPDRAAEVIDKVWDYCTAERVAFKFLRSQDVLTAGNAKYADRGSSGKLVAIYPHDEVTLERALRDLHAALAGVQGPYVLSDLRWGSGPLYVRFGGFVDRYCVSETGEQVLAVQRPDGVLVPDRRGPAFEVPAWAPVPDFIRAQIDAAGTGPAAEFPYRIERALHFSNGGGIYLATDPATGRKVVLREARPFAALDSAGADAVARLHAERAALEAAAGLPFVPAVLGHFRYWEHHYLVEEYIEGETLRSSIAHRYPLTRARADARRTAAYTTWALDVLDQVDAALTELHARGLVFGDLHPSNILVRPDGRIALIDFEGATNVASETPVTMGAAGFAARGVRQGTAVDAYAMACLRLAMFLPLTVLLDKADGKAADLVARVHERFPVPERFGAQVLQGLAVASIGAVVTPAQSRPSARDAGATPAWQDPHPDWSALRECVAEGILASATPWRSDRLFPGDIEQFRDGGLNVAHGAAGVLYALSDTGVGTREEHVEWLVRMTRRTRNPRPGLYDGLHGIAYVLDHLGRRTAALDVLDRALELTDRVTAAGLFDGLAGIGLNLLHFCSVTGDDSLHGAAMDVADRLARALGKDVADLRGPVWRRPGLMHGATGAASLFLRLHALEPAGPWLVFAAQALRCDLRSCEVSEGTLQMRDEGRLLPYLAEGSAGLGIVLDQYGRYRHDPAFELAQRRIERACAAEFVIGSGLFTGRAGLLAYLAERKTTREDTPRRGALNNHMRRLGWHAVRHDGHYAFPGEYLLRLSMDVATGSAGVVLAMDSALGSPTSVLPLLGAGRGEVTRHHSSAPSAVPAPGGRAASAA